MERVDAKTDKAIRLLTRLAYGDVGLVRSALVKRETAGVAAVITYINDRRRKPAPDVSAPGQAAPC